MRVIDWENAEGNDFLLVSQMSIWMQFADTHCGAEVLKVGVCSKFYSKFYTEVLKVGVCSKFYRSDESGCLQ